VYSFTAVADGRAFECTTSLPRRSIEGTDDTCTAGIELRSESVDEESGGSNTETLSPNIQALILHGKFRKVAVEVKQDGRSLGSDTFAPSYGELRGEPQCGKCPVARETIELR
jgi:hypothetical protein